MRSMPYQRNIRSCALEGLGGLSRDSRRMNSGLGCGCMGARVGSGRSLSMNGQSCPWSETDGRHTNNESTADDRRSSGCGRSSDGNGGSCGRSSNGRASRGGYNHGSVQQREVPSVDEGCGCGCGNSDNGECTKLMRQIQTVDFALYEVVLYLDAYPKDCEALNTYHMLLARRRKLADAYEEACGPLTAWGNVSTTSWDWVKGPTPWEYPKD